MGFHSLSSMALSTPPWLPEQGQHGPVPLEIACAGSPAAAEDSGAGDSEPAQPSVESAGGTRLNRIAQSVGSTVQTFTAPMLVSQLLPVPRSARPPLVALGQCAMFSKQANAASSNLDQRGIAVQGASWLLGFGSSFAAVDAYSASSYGKSALALLDGKGASAADCVQRLVSGKENRSARWRAGAGSPGALAFSAGSQILGAGLGAVVQGSITTPAEEPIHAPQSPCSTASDSTPSRIAIAASDSAFLVGAGFVNPALTARLPPGVAGAARAIVLSGAATAMLVARIPEKSSSAGSS